MRKTGWKTAALAAALLLALLLGACGEKRETLRINDRGVVTELEFPLPARVDEILAEAEIVLRPGDSCEPAADTVLREPCEITVLRRNLVTLIVEDRAKTVLICGGTVRDLLEREGIRPGPGLRPDVDEDAWLTDGMVVRLSSRCTVELCLYGRTIVADVTADTVGEALSACGVLPSADDRVTPAPDEPVTDGMTIRVSRLSYETVEQREPIGYTTVYRRDGTLEPGTEKLETAGEDGEKLVTYRLTLVDGVEESREPIAERILREPVDALILTGPVDTTSLTIVSKKAYYDCDGSGHGYYEIVYSDGTVEYVPF